MSNSQDQTISATSATSASHSIDLKVSRVTMFEDRAQVVRVGRVSSPGHRDVIIHDVSPLTSAERTKVVATNTDDKTRVLVDDLRIEHVWIEEESEQTIKAEECRRVLVENSTALKDIQAKIRLADVAREATLNAYKRWQKRTGAVAFLQEVSRKDWQEGTRDVEVSLREGEDRRMELLRAQRTAQEELNTAQVLLEQAADLRKRLCANIVLRLSNATGDVDLEISSTIPCAMWRPTHVAHLLNRPPPIHEEDREGGDKSDDDAASFDDDGPTNPQASDAVSIDFASAESNALSVEWTVAAALWQKTGEDWDDVEVFLSTERPSKGAVLPTLHADKLSARTKTPEERRTIQVEHRTESATPDAATGVVPGVYDGGSARLFKIPGRVSLKSDGRPKQMAVRTFVTGLDVDRVAFPDESERVFRRAKLTNVLDVPLLAGPVSLRESGAFIGVGDLRYVGPLEKFSMSFGTDDGLVVRTRRYQSIEARRIAKDKTHYVTEVTLLSARSNATNVDVIMRWPVSELEQVKVVYSPAFTTGGNPNPDQDGLVHTPVKVPASGRAMVQLGFTFDVSSGVNLPPPW